MRLETERLILRRWEERDRAPLGRILGDPHIRRFYERALTPDEASREIDIARERTAANGFHMQAAELKSTGDLIGLIGIGVIPDRTRAVLRGNPRVEIGWALDQSVWGQGFAPEGARAWLAYAWDVLKLDEVVAFTAAINRPSQRVMEKIGMVRDLAGDYLHPSVSEGSRLRPHVLFRIQNPSLR